MTRRSISSAVIEHVGSFENQRRMVSECLRVARRGVCITTPNRWFPIEFHTQLPLLHRLPKPKCRSLFEELGYGLFAREENLNLVTASDFGKITGPIKGWEFEVQYASLLD